MLGYMASIEARPNADGTTSYRVIWRDPADSKRRRITFGNRVDAEDWRVILEKAGPDAALRVLQTPDAREAETVSQAIDRHLAGLSGIEEGTRRDYRRIADRVIGPALGAIPITALHRDDVARWINDQEDAGVTPKTIMNRHSLLSAALASAHQDGRVERNVARGVRLPRAQRSEMVFLTQEEFGELVALFSERWRPLVLLLGATGMRWSEATALQVGDVDLPGRQIRVVRAWKETRSSVTKIGVTKSRRGERTIPLPTACRADLERLTAGRPPDAWVLTSPRGDKPVVHSSFYTRAWQPAVSEFAAAHGKRPRIHDLRHSYASWAIAAGHSLTAIQRVMGHESIQTTSDRYGHLFRADRDAFADLVVVTPRPAIES